MGETRPRGLNGALGLGQAETLAGATEGAGLAPTVSRLSRMRPGADGSYAVLGPVPVFYADVSDTWDGTGNTLTLAFTLPYEGVWDLRGRFRSTGGATIGAGQAAWVEVSFSGISNSAILHQYPPTPQPAGDPTTWDTGATATFPVPALFAAGIGLPQDDALEREFTATTAAIGNTADWVAVGVNLNLTAIYLGPSAVRTGW